MLDYVIVQNNVPSHGYDILIDAQLTKTDSAVYLKRQDTGYTQLSRYGSSYTCVYILVHVQM